MVRLRSSGSQVKANFGHQPFECPPAPEFASKDSEMVRKLREDQEHAQRQLRDAEDSKLAAREAQVSWLNHMKYCLLGNINFFLPFCVMCRLIC